MAAADLLFGDGARVVAMGRLVREGSDWWLDSTRVRTLAMARDGGRGEHAVRLAGADQHVAALRKQDSLAVRSWLHVIGRWTRGSIAVEAIGAGPGRPDLPAGEQLVADPAAVQHRREQLAVITAALDAHRDGWGIERCSTDNLAADGLPYAAVELFRVTAELATWADSHPVGLVLLDPSVRTAV